jgi:hypothetical protein
MWATNLQKNKLMVVAVEKARQFVLQIRHFFGLMGRQGAVGGGKRRKNEWREGWKRHRCQCEHDNSR